MYVACPLYTQCVQILREIQAVNLSLLQSAIITYIPDLIPILHPVSFP